jgi:hypothetical protein
MRIYGAGSKSVSNLGVKETAAVRWARKAAVKLRMDTAGQTIFVTGTRASKAWKANCEIGQMGWEQELPFSKDNARSSRVGSFLARHVRRGYS